MSVSRVQIAIAVGAGVLVLMIFFGYLMWLDRRGPVLSPLRGPRSALGNPEFDRPRSLRDRTTERVAAKYLDAMRDGHCQEQLADWEKDCRKKYAAFICSSEAQHPLTCRPPTAVRARARRLPIVGVQRAELARRLPGGLGDRRE